MPVIKLGDFDDARVKALLTRHLEGMHEHSPPGHVFALDWSGLQRPEISFYTLWEGEDLLGFGALKELEPWAGEIKSMRTADEHLRKGVAAAILEHIIAEARKRRYSRLSLETGSGPAFEPALTLYRKYGFLSGGPFGEYEQSSFNQFLHLELDAPPRDGRQPRTEDPIRATHVGEIKPARDRVLMVDHDPRWADLFEHEAVRIRRAMEDRAMRVEHVGSTSVPGLAAKPVIDIVLVTRFLRLFTEWAAAQPDIQAAALVGSHARGSARPTSDIDLVILADEPERFLTDAAWTETFGRPAAVSREDYGNLTSFRVHYQDAFEVEFGFTTVRWADVPVDPGTRDVISGGMRVLVERGRILSRLL